MIERPYSKLLWIAVLTMVAVAVVKPNGQLSLYGFERQFRFSQGLDLQGGLHLKYALDLTGVGESARREAIEGTRRVIEKRINPLGVSEPVVHITRVGNDAAIIVELPGQKDSEAATKSIGQTAKLTFQKQDETGTSSTGFTPTDLTGADLRPNGASIGTNPTTGAPQINLSFTPEGGRKFEKLTSEIVGQPLAILLDDQPLQVATVQETIAGGQAQITGTFTLREAQETIRLLNAGALPVPMKLVEQRIIGATLGEESVKRSLIAGLAGLAAVAVFMVGYYRLLGVVAVVALVLYALFSLAIFKALPVTLTLSGITGFILSIGMAVDANILIFERYREEIARGQSPSTALKNGFDRAWTSIRDSNASSIITALILYNFASSSLIQGFSLTLIIGIIVSMFTAITVSRTLLALRLAPPTLTPRPATVPRPAPVSPRKGRW